MWNCGMVCLPVILMARRKFDSETERCCVERWRGGYGGFAFGARGLLRWLRSIVNSVDEKGKAEQMRRSDYLHVHARRIFSPCV